MTSVKAVVFDLDDTLYPERAYAFSGFDAVASAFEDLLGDTARASQQMRELFDTEHRPTVFNALLARLGLAEDEQVIQDMVLTYRQHKPVIALHRDADDALTRLRKYRKLGLITDGPAISQSAKIEALNLSNRFDAAILTEQLGPIYRKPHPRAFELIAERLGDCGSQCAYVADNLAKDFVAPNALGWKTVQIRRADGIYRNASPAPHGNPCHTIDSLDLLDTLLK